MNICIIFLWQSHKHTVHTCTYTQPITTAILITCYRRRHTLQVSLSVLPALSLSQEFRYNNIFPNLTFNPSKQITVEIPHLSISWNVFIVESTHRHTHAHTECMHTVIVILQSTSLRSHPDCQGNMLICDFIGENGVLHFHYWHHLTAPRGIRDRCTCMCVGWVMWVGVVVRQV